MNVFFDPEVLYTAADSRFKTFGDVIDEARKGGGRWGAANPASLERQTLEQLKRKAGVSPAVVTFDGGGDMLINVLNHTLDMGIGELQEIRGQLDAAHGCVLLAVVGDDRLTQFPDVATRERAGHRPVGPQVPRAGGSEGHAGPTSSRRWRRRFRSCSTDPAYRAHLPRTACSPASCRTTSTSRSSPRSAGRRKRSSRSRASSDERDCRETCALRHRDARRRRSPTTGWRPRFPTARSPTQSDHRGCRGLTPPFSRRCR